MGLTGFDESRDAAAVFYRALLLHTPLVVFSGLFFGMAAHYTRFIPTAIGTGVLTLTACLPLYEFYSSNRLPTHIRRIPRPQLFACGLLIAIFVLHVIFGNVATIKLGLWPLYTSIVTVSSLFFVPAVVSQRGMFVGLSVSGALLGVCAALVQLTGAWIFLPDFTPPTANQSVFLSPNLVSMLPVVGLMVGAVYYTRTRHHVWAVLAALNALCLYLTHSRGGYLGLLSVVGTYLLLTRGDRRVTTRVLAGIAVAVSGGVLLTGLFPKNPFVAASPLATRAWLWHATIIGVAKTNPIVGVGWVVQRFWLLDIVPEMPLERPHGPHNSYLYIAIRSGVVGMGAYIVLVWGSIFDGINKRADPLVISLAVGFALNFTVDQYTLWGVTIRSVIAALVVGYLIADIAEFGDRIQTRGNWEKYRN
ncbi:O-antigen ligase family protein [Haladaptatus sp. NG-SE-30]